MKISYNNRAKYIAFILFFLASAVFVYPGCKGKTPKAETKPVSDSVKVEKAKIDLSKYDKKFDDYAKFLGGISVDSNSAHKELFATAAWKAHKTDLDQSWAQFRKDRLDEITKWRDVELAEANAKGKTVLYPFGGPDFFFANTFFPNAETYVLQGLEQVYTVPELQTINNANLQRYLKTLQGSLRVIFKGGYFITKEMAVDFNSGPLRGVVPVLLLFMSRTDNTVLDIQYIVSDATGNFKLKPEDLLVGDAAVKHNGKLKGVKITFVDKKAEVLKTLYYFSTDMQNPAFEKLTAYKSLVTENKPVVGMAKAASYLMHGKGFSDVKDFVIANCDFYLQTDTGIPYKFFDQNVWELNLYGNYVRPINQFPWAYQDDLRKVYQTDKNIKKLPFSIDYNFENGTSNMMYARKKAK